VILPFGSGGAGGGWRWLETGLVDMFATKLNHLSKLRTVSLERLLDKSGPLSLRGVTGLSTGVALRYFQTRAVLTGKITALNGGFRLDILLVGRKEEDPLMEDYRHYVMAVEDYVISDDSSLPRAVDHLHKAVATDSTFSRAHFLLAKVYDQAEALGIPQGLVQDPLARANRFPDRLPEWERQFARGWQLWLVEGDLEEAVSVLSGLSKEYPDDAWHEGLPLILGYLLVHQGRWPQAIQQLKAYVKEQETPILRKGLGWGQLATAYQMTGDMATVTGGFKKTWLSPCSVSRTRNQRLPRES